MLEEMPKRSIVFREGPPVIREGDLVRIRPEAIDKLDEEKQAQILKLGKNGILRVYARSGDPDEGTGSSPEDWAFLGDLTKSPSEIINMMAEIENVENLSERYIVSVDLADLMPVSN